MTKTKIAKFEGSNALVTAMGFSKVEKEKPLIEDAGCPRIFNYTSGGKNGGLGTDIKKSIPDVEEGSPILSIGGQFVELPTKTVRYVVLPNFLRQFWADKDYGKKILKTSNEKKKFGEGRKEGATTGYLENILALILVVGAYDNNGNKLMPVPTVSTFDKSRCPFLVGARKELSKVDTKEWAANSSENAKLVAAGVPESLRVTHRIKVKIDTAASHGLTYARWTNDTQTSSEDLISEIQEAMSDPTWQDHFKEAQEMFARLSADIDEKLA